MPIGSVISAWTGKIRFVLAISAAAAVLSSTAGFAGPLVEQAAPARADITGALPAGVGSNSTTSERLHREIRASLDQRIRIEGLLGDLTRDLLDDPPRIGDKLATNATLDDLPAGIQQLAQRFGYSQIDQWAFVASDLQGDFVLVDASRIVVSIVKAPVR
jgi:hypothetical protein